MQENLGKCCEEIHETILVVAARGPWFPAGGAGWHLELQPPPVDAQVPTGCSTKGKQTYQWYINYEVPIASESSTPSPFGNKVRFLWLWGVEKEIE